MRLHQYDPRRSLSYTAVVGGLLRDFQSFQAPEDIVFRFGPERLRDVTLMPELTSGGLTPLPSGLEQRIFQFKESASCGGACDVVFSQGQLVDCRIQMFFEGALAGMRGAIYSRLRLRSLLERLAGVRPIGFDDRTHRFVACLNGVAVSFGCLSDFGISSVCTWIDRCDEKEPCPVDMDGQCRTHLAAPVPMPGF